MPLSEHEQRLLEQIERALYAEDPKFASAVRSTDPRTYYRRRIVRSLAGFVLGLAALLAGVVTKLIPLGVAGFLLMLAAVLFAAGAYSRMHGRRMSGAVPIGRRRGLRGGLRRGPSRRHPSGATAPAGRRMTLRERLEARWQRRWDDRYR